MFEHIFLLSERLFVAFKGKFPHGGIKQGNPFPTVATAYVQNVLLLISTVNEQSKVTPHQCLWCHSV